MRFPENECRVCEKVFCCEKCRLKHEISVHDFKEDCGVCQYGYLSSKNLNEALLQHLKNRHWPLHCVLCKFIFATTQDILKIHKCGVVGCKEDSPKTPYRNPSEGLAPTSEASPILPGTQYKETPVLNLNLITSTPMQRNDNMMKKDFNKHSQIVTPVDHVQMSKPTADSDDNVSAQVTKRRVTFCEMSLADNVKTNTPERECDEVMPKQLRDHFSAVAMDSYTPKRVQPSIDRDEKQDQPQHEFSTPGRSDKSIIYDDEPMEFTPARSSIFSISGCTTEEMEEKSHDEFKQELEEIMSNNNQISEKNQSEIDIIHEEQDGMKDGTTIWMSALNLSEEPSEEREETNLEVISNQNSNEIPEDSLAKIIISTASTIANPTPILKKGVTNVSQGKRSAFSPVLKEVKLINSVLDDNPQDSVKQNKENSVADYCVIEMDYSKDIVEPYKENPTIDPIVQEEANSDKLIERIAAMDHSSQEEASLECIKKENNDCIVSEKANIKCNKEVYKDYSVQQEENKENLTLDAKNKTIKMYPTTPYPILKRQDVNIELSVKNEKDEPAQNNETNNEKEGVIIRRFRSNVNKRLLEEYSKNSTLNSEKDSKEAIVEVNEEEDNLTTNEEEDNLTTNSSLMEQIVRMHPTPHPELKIVRMHPTPHPELKQGILKKESQDNYNQISNADGDANSKEINSKVEEDKENVTINSPLKKKMLQRHPTPYSKLKQRNVELLTKINEISLPKVLRNSPERQEVKVQQNANRELPTEIDINDLQVVKVQPNANTEPDFTKIPVEIDENITRKLVRNSPEKRQVVKVQPNANTEPDNTKIPTETDENVTPKLVRNSPEKRQIVKVQANANTEPNCIEIPTETDENITPRLVRNSPEKRQIVKVQANANTEPDNTKIPTETDENVTPRLVRNSPEKRQIVKVQANANTKPDSTEIPTETDENITPRLVRNSPEKRQVVKVQPTPITRRTNIHMKFHIPAHLSSTPILNMHPQPKMVKKVLTRQIVLQQGETNFCETSTTEMVGQINRSESISEIDRDSNSMAGHQESSVACEQSKSNVWSSMARMVKRVIQRTVSFSNDSFDLRRSDDNRFAIAGTSFKRHFSESDSPEMALTQQTKRFKFTDIKCRPPIRDISPLRPRARMLALPSTSTGGAATFEIVKSVTTTHTVPERKVCFDKATQTDAFLMD